MSHIFSRAEFTTAAASLGQLPPDSGLEVAFAGRSNAGKSSAINAITGRRGLARTSKTPGRTQLINFFRLDDQRRLVDLPGYGYAKVAQDVKARWQKTLGQYLQRRRALRGLVLIMDIRHPLTVLDRELLGWCREAGLPVHVLLTKADKLSRGRAQAARLAVLHALDAEFPGVSVQLFSALKPDGVDEARAQLEGWLQIAQA